MSSVIERSLSGGELDPVLWSRSDLSKYMSGLRTLRNGFVRRNGGVQGRPGSTMVQQTKISSFNVRLVKFVYNQTTTFAMEFGDKYIRFYSNGQAFQASVDGAYGGLGSGHYWAYGNVVSQSGANYLVAENSGTPPLSTPAWGPNLNIYTYPVPAAGYSFADNGGLTLSTYGAGSFYPLTGTTYEIPTPYLHTDLAALRFDQTGNDVVITHPNYQPMRLTRIAGGTSYGIGFRSGTGNFGSDRFLLFYVNIGTYVNLPLTGYTGIVSNNQSDANVQSIAAAKTVYAVVPINSAGDMYAEQLDTNGSTSLLVVGVHVTTTSTVPASGTPIAINFTATPGAVSYNIYYLNHNSGVFGFVGSTTAHTFVDNGITPDYGNPWVQAATPLSSSNNYPACCAFYQQRLFYGNTNNSPTTVWGSQTGLYDNFNVNVPSLATDALNFKMAGQQDIIQHLVSLGTLLVFTYGTINSVQGDASGAISPSAINPHRESVHGASSLRPLIVGEFALYCQSQGSVIRDLGFNFQVDGYRGDDLTVFATHLFDNYTISDWDYQATPNSIAWAVRSDGTLLSLTYVREQQVLAWAHHDTNGTYESVCCIPEGNQVSVYVVANRNGTRFVERFAAQSFTDVRNYVGVDCATTVDGRSSHLLFPGNMTLTGGTLWNETELLTLTAGGGTTFSFTSTMVTNGDMVFLYDPSGNLYRFKITAFTSSTVVHGFLDRLLAVSLQGTATANWSYASAVITGLAYLNGYSVSVFGDGTVVGSPNNPNLATVYTVSGGQITLDQPYAVVQVGLPYLTDIETLDIDTQALMDNLGSYFKLVGEVCLYVVNSRPVWIGGKNPDTDPATDGTTTYRLVEQKVRQWETYDSPVALHTGKITQQIQPEWDSNGHVFIRNVDPAPLVVSAISPEGLIPQRVG